MSEDHGSYYVPAFSRLPILTALSLFLFAYGTLEYYRSSLGVLFLFLGLILFLVVIYSWFHMIVEESQRGYYDAQMHRSFRWGMLWFLFTDAAIFGILFMALLYVRVFSIPDLGGEGYFSSSALTHLLLWPNFSPDWPLINNPNPLAYQQASKPFAIWGFSAVTTLILFLSTASMNWGYLTIFHQMRKPLLISLVITIFLGLIFTILQAISLIYLVSLYNLNINSGIYSSIFYFLNGVFIAHLLAAIIFLVVIFIRAYHSHFTRENHFALQAATWFWNYLCVVWAIIFLFLYWF